MRREPTPAEKRLWSRVRNQRLGGFKFRRQHWLGAFILDFYCPEAALVVELDGDSHATDGAEQEDKERTAFLEAHGLKVIRFWNSQVHDNEDWVLGVIRQACEERARRTPAASEEAVE
jgi:very-short-patch-repair endonuclease